MAVFVAFHTAERLALDVHYQPRATSSKGEDMMRTTVVTLVLALGLAVQADAQGRGNRGQDRRGRNDAARAQGVPPGQMPPETMCRVWYSDRSNGRQPAPTDCRTAEAIAARNYNARVIYGENVYYARNRNRVNPGGRVDRYPSPEGRYPDVYGRPDVYGGDDRAVRRPGSNRDPRNAGGDPYYDRSSRYTTPAFQNGYRDGLEKGREDGEDNDRYDLNRHNWYRSATRGYEDEYGPRTEYSARYREGFEAGYAEGYRRFARR